jgi:hypothetical protein
MTPAAEASSWPLTQEARNPALGRQVFTAQSQRHNSIYDYVRNGSLAGRSTRSVVGCRDDWQIFSPAHIATPWPSFCQCEKTVLAPQIFAPPDAGEEKIEEAKQ